MGTSLSVDTVHAVLSKPGRRRVIRRLAVADGPVPVAELAGSLPAPDRSARVRLHHVVLPKLLEAGVVAYEGAGRQVSLTPAGERVEAVRSTTAAMLDGE